MDLLVLIIVAVISFFLGWIMREYHAVMMMDKFVHRVERNINNKMQELKENTIKIKIEKHNNEYLVYNLDDNSFMAQGMTRKELEENLSKRFPGKMFAAEDENLKEVGFKHESI